MMFWLAALSLISLAANPGDRTYNEYVNGGEEDTNMHAMECDKLEQAFRTHESGSIVALHEFGGCTLLYLANAKGGDDLARAIADYLPMSTKLRTLWLDGVKITDRGMELIAEALAVNKALMKLSVRNTPATGPRDAPGMPRWESLFSEASFSYDSLYWVRGDLPVHPIHEKVRSQMQKRTAEKRAAQLRAAAYARAAEL